jgi:ketosteroid isomerase-like protein
MVHVHLFSTFATLFCRQGNATLRIKISDTLETSDTEMILQALERSLRDVSMEVVRQGRQITLRGLGPSQRTMNHNDITVLEVNTESNRTVIRADVTYQASALLGEMSQDDIVRSKLERVIDSVKMRTGVRGVRVPAAAMAPVPEPVVVMAKPIRVVETPAVVAPQAEAVVTVSAPVVPRGVLEPVEPIIPVQQRPGTSSSASSSIPQQSEERQEVRILEVLQPEESKQARPWGIAAAVACVLAAVLVFLAWPYLLGLVEKGTHSGSGSVNVERVRPSSEASSRLGPNEQKILESGSATAKRALIHREADPAVWVQSWVAAMRTQDATEQASFYADPVDRYFFKSNVSNADVLADKQRAIENRRGLWTVRLENVAIERRPDSTVRVRMVKHFISQPEDGQISEQSIRSQLELKRINGEWKITAEQNHR